LTISLVMVGAYVAVGLASNNSPKALWASDSVTIQFSGNSGTSSSGSVADSFKCAPPVSNPISLRALVSNPTKISLTLSQSRFASCGPPFTTVTLTAHCVVANCKGSYAGAVAVFRNQYTTVPPSLQVTIIIT